MEDRILRFPGFKQKAFTLNYDDGNIFDVPMIEKMARYHVRGTFNLDSDMFGKGRRMDFAEVKDLYTGNGMEIACHGARHIALSHHTYAMAAQDILNDKLRLEEMFGQIIKGFAYAYSAYDQEIENLLHDFGFLYARAAYGKNGDGTGTFGLPKNFMDVHPTCHHKNPRLIEFCDQFLLDNRDPFWFRPKNFPRWFLVWGHSYEFNDNDQWPILDDLLQRVGNRDDIFYGTTSEICEYIRAFRSLIYSADETMIENPTATDVYLDLPSGETIVPAGKTIRVEKVRYDDFHA